LKEVSLIRLRKGNKAKVTEENASILFLPDKKDSGNMAMVVLQSLASYNLASTKIFQPSSLSVPFLYFLFLGAFFV
jgi:hypothetical protein